MEDFKGSYYLSLFYILTVFVALVFTLIYTKDSRIGRFFIFYLSIDLIIFIIDTYRSNFSSLTLTQRNFFIYLSNTLISVIELTVYVIYFRTILQSRAIKKIINILKFIFLFVLILYTINCFPATRFYPIYRFSDLINVSEFIIIIILSLTYYIKLFKDDSKEDLMKRPSFWIVTGIFFLALLSMPYNLISYYLVSKRPWFYEEFIMIIFYIPLSINYIFLTKAFLCRKPLTI